ncbi:integrase [Azonexus sp.]|uniref:integrase n=1 Tax=Azonexus sp. TaxID=1872668 RepID=UPI0035B10673
MRPVPIEATCLAGLEPQAKACLAVSKAIDAEGNPITISCYEDDVWNFWPYITRENAKDGQKRIIWSIALPGGTKLTDEKHRHLLVSAKDFIWSLHVDPVDGSKRPSMKTLISLIANLAFLLRWMLHNGIDRFSQLAGRTHEYVIAARNGGSDAKNTVMRRLLLVEKLYAQAGKIDDFLPEHPWPFESAYVLAGIDQRMAHRIPKTLVIPDDAFIQLAKSAIEYVDERAGGILDIHAEAEEAMAAARRRGVTDKIYIYGFGTNVARAHGYPGLRELGVEISMLRSACYICINMFSGLRNSEMMSLDANCITRARSIDDSYECIWLHGTIYKTGQRPHKWLVPPIVERAVNLARELGGPFREMLKAEASRLEEVLASGANSSDVRLTKRLFEIHRARNKLFLSVNYSGQGPQGVVPSNAAVNKWLKDFCHHCDILGPDGEPWRLACHQFRRTFAYNYARSELGDLLYLKEHYGHWSLDMTMLYVDGGADVYQVDNGLLDDVVRVKQQRQSEILCSYLESDVPLANGDEWLGTWRPMVRTAKNKEELIRELSGSITLNGTGHSWCAGNAKGGNCGGLCIFEADMCVDCNTAIIGPEHLPVWQEIAGQQRLVLDLPDMGVPAKSRARRILAKANQVIATLDRR